MSDMPTLDRRQRRRPHDNQAARDLREHTRFVLYCKKTAPSAKQRAKVQNVPFEIDWHTIANLLTDQNWKCALTGIELVPPDKGVPKHPFGPSLDRIVPTLGYVPGNVRVVCNMINFAMSNWGFEAVEKMASAMRTFKKQQRLNTAEGAKRGVVTP